MAVNKDYIETLTECLRIFKPSVSLNHNASSTVLHLWDDALMLVHSDIFMLHVLPKKPKLVFRVNATFSKECCGVSGCRLARFKFEGFIVDFLL